MRPIRLPLTLLLLLPLLLAGCATMDADQCRQADWRAVGLRDGQNGEPLALMERRAKDCADNQVRLDTARYQEGRNQGLPQFCRVELAARFGLEGKPYHGVCPPAIDPEFKRRHAVGWEVNQARAAMRDLDTRQQSAETRLSKAKTDEDRRRARQDLRELDGDIRRARDRVRDAEWNFDRLR